MGVVGLKNDGTVVSTGLNYLFRETFDTAPRVEDWTDVVQIDACEFTIVGLRKDGTVVATGGDVAIENQDELAEWTDIVSVAAGHYFIAGLTDQGTVRIAYKDRFLSDEEKHPLEEWTDIVAIDMGENLLIGLRSDGTAVVGDGKDVLDVIDDWEQLAKGE